MTEFARALMWIGGGIFVLGGILWLARNIPWLGRLPGDFFIQRGNFTLFAPLGTMIVLSLLLSLVLNIILRILR